MFKIIKKSEYEKLKLDLELKNKEISNLVEQNLNLQNEKLDLIIKLKEFSKYEEIIKKGILCYEVYPESEKVYFYKFLNGERVSFHRMSASYKNALKIIEERNIKSYEELTVDYLLSL